MVTRLLAYVKGLVRRNAIDAEVDEELRFHIEMEIQANIERGMTPQEARRIALRDLGGVTQTKQAVRGVRSGAIEAVVRDVRLAARMLAKSPDFAVTTVVTLALGIGANAAIFGIADAMMIRRLPYTDADRIVRLKGFSGQAFIMWGGPDGFAVHPAELRTSRAFGAVGAAVMGGLNLGRDSAQRVRAAAVTTGFFDALGVSPALGRLFTSQDVTRTPHVVVISDHVWRGRFAADRAVAGKTVLLNGRPFTIVGVMPPRVSYPAAADVWVPSGSSGEFTTGVPTAVVLARLAAGVTATQAHDAVAGIMSAYLATLFQAIPSGTARIGGPTEAPRIPRVEISVISLRTELVGEIRPIVVLTTVAALLVLLVACINAAHLLLGRLGAREREFAVRRALGASRGQLARQVLVESLLLSAVAGLAAIPAAAWTLDIIHTLLPSTLYGVADIAINGRVVTATAALSLCTALLFGVAPALSLPGRHDADVLRGIPSRSAGRFVRLLRSALVVAEVAAALVLLAGAATIVRTVSNLMRVDTGVRADNALAFDVMLPDATYPKNAVRTTFARVAEQLRGIPGIEAVGATTQVPGRPDPLIADHEIKMNGQFIGNDPRSRFAVSIRATPGYFAAAGIERLAGREFTDADREGAPCVVVVSERLAAVAGLSPDAIVGRRLDHGRAPSEKGCTVVGVVRNVLLRGPEQALEGTRAAIYSPYEQSGSRYRDRHFVVRTHVEPGLLLPAVRRALARIDPALPLYDVQTFGEIRAALLADRRFAMAAMIAFGLLTCVLAALGLYGVLAHAVQQRTREIGIRLALGATPGSVSGLILRHGIALAVAGLVLGTACTLASWRLVAANVPKLGQLDAAIIAPLSVAILVVAAAATWAPARRATRVDPIVTLRAE